MALKPVKLGNLQHVCSVPPGRGRLCATLILFRRTTLRSAGIALADGPPAGRRTWMARLGTDYHPSLDDDKHMTTLGTIQ